MYNELNCGTEIWCKNQKQGTALVRSGGRNGIVSKYLVTGAAYIMLFL